MFDPSVFSEAGERPSGLDAGVVDADVEL